MKATIFFFSIFAFKVILAQTNQITITASGGLHSTVTKIYGSNPVIDENTQISKTPVAALRIYKTGKKSNGIWLGLSGNADALSVKHREQDQFGYRRGGMYTEGTLARFEFGYHLITKKIFFNNILSESNQKNKGFFTQIQPIIGATYIKNSNLDQGYIGSGNLTIVYSTSSTLSLGLVYGMNFYFGKNERTWFFINVQHNINFNQSTSSGVFSYTNNGITTSNRVETNGSGFSFQGGLVLYKFKYRK